MPNYLYPKFEVIKEFQGEEELLLPKRATATSAGYDFVVAKDTIVPSYLNHIDKLNKHFDNIMWENIPIPCEPYNLKDVALATKIMQTKPTLVPTGVKAYIPKDLYLQLSVRSSCPLKSWLILANGVGIIDADYYNNPDNEGHIYFQIINLFPYDIILKKGDKIGQGIFLPYYKVGDDETAAARTGGFGSTSK